MDASAVPLKSSALALPNLDRIIRGLLLVYIFSLPFKGLLFIERNGFIILLVLLGLWCAISRRPVFVRTPLDAPLAAFVLWVAVTIPFAAYPSYSLQEFGKLLQQGVVFYAVAFFFREREQWTQLLWLVVGLLGIVSAYGLIQFEETAKGGGSFLRAEVWLTTYLIMLLPLSFAMAWYEQNPWARGLYATVTASATVCLLLTQSRAGLLAFVVELWACAWLVKQRAMWVLSGAVTAALAALMFSLVTVTMTPDGQVTLAARTSVPIKTSTDSFVHRMDIWAFMLERIAEHPILGIGYGKETSKLLFNQTPEQNVPAGHAPVRTHGTHNIMLELALLVGLPGMALFIWLVIRLGRMVVRGFHRATDVLPRAVLLGVSVGLIGLGVRLQFDQMLVGTLAVQFWVLVAVAMRACDVEGAADRLPQAMWDGGPGTGWRVSHEHDGPAGAVK
jgi:O-antigen ligase